MNQVSFDDFSCIFHENLYKRSRTAKGVSDTSSSREKKKLLVAGDELKALVCRNTDALVENVWRAGHLPEGPEAIRGLLEGWYDCINRDLQDPDAYRDHYDVLEKEAATRRQKSSLNWRVNRRYRAWDVSYTKYNLGPLDLEFAMDAFYQALFFQIVEAQAGYLDPARILSFADYFVDGEIHPWADGCGRNATALVMWLSLVIPGCDLPVFGTREEHYASIHNFEAHVIYFQHCLFRA